MKQNDLTMIWFMSILDSMTESQRKRFKKSFEKHLEIFTKEKKK